MGFPAASRADLKLTELWDEPDESTGFSDAFNGWCVEPGDGSAGYALLRDAAQVEFALGTEFEHFRALQKYEGVWSESRGVVEAELLLPRPSPFLAHPFYWIQKSLGLGSSSVGPKTPPADTIIPIPVEPPNVEVELAFACREQLVWRTGSPAINVFDSNALIPVIRIRRLAPLAAEGAITLLETLGLAAILELELSCRVAARLKVPYPFRLRFDGPPMTPAFGTLRRYPPSVPAQLYLHARLNEDDAANTFLSLYHVLEYFFPHFSCLAEAAVIRKKLLSRSHALADMAESEIATILGEGRFATGARGIGKEKDQLVATVEAAITSEELRRLLICNGFKDFYTSLTPPLVSQRIRVEEPKANLRRELAERLYAIRCRIVHKKSSSADVLLPFAAEVADLHYDLKLIEDLARRLLSATSLPL